MLTRRQTSSREAPWWSPEKRIDTLATVLAVGLLGATTWRTHRFVSRYGWKGLLMYIWDGNPYPIHLRDGMERLDKANKKIADLSEAVARLELALAHARRNTSSPSGRELIDKWSIAANRWDLPFYLSQLSDDIDKAAGMVDGVLSEGEVRVKDRKKELSNKAVDLMEYVDGLISLYTVACD